MVSKTTISETRKAKVPGGTPGHVFLGLVWICLLVDGSV